MKQYANKHAVWEVSTCLLTRLRSSVCCGDRAYSCRCRQAQLMCMHVMVAAYAASKQ
jgi:hypothetical protein